MEENLYHTGAAYQPPMAQNPMHVRHASMSTAIPDPYQRASLQEHHLVRAVAPIDTASNSSYQTSASGLHPVLSQPSLNHSPIGPKPEPVYEEEEVHSAPYAPVPARVSYATTSPPMSMPTLDTSFSHAIARPDYPQAPHTTSHIHDSPTSHYSPQSATGPPPAKKGRIETSYPTFTSVSWDHPVSAPVTAADISPVHPDQSTLPIHNPLETFSFPQTTTPFHDHAFTFSHAPAPVMYSQLAPDFGAHHQGMFMPHQGYSPQLTAPS